jgi:hypothetical protein
MEFRLLNRKCGLICALRAFSSDSRASVSASCSRRLGFLGRFHREQHVVQRHRQQVQEHADAEQQRKLRAEAFVQPHEEVAPQSEAQPLGQHDPNQPGDNRGSQVFADNLESRRGAKRQHAGTCTTAPGK